MKFIEQDSVFMSDVIHIAVEMDDGRIGYYEVTLYDIMDNEDSLDFSDGLMAE